MASYIEVPLNKGVVLTRADHVLDHGEMVDAATVRYKRGDQEQLHRDTGAVIFGRNQVTDSPDGDSWQGGDFADLKVLSFEDGGSALLALMDNKNGNYTLATSEGDLRFPAVNLPWVVRATAAEDTPGSSGSCAAIHRGDQYFVGAGLEESYVVSAKDSWDRMGMRDQADVWSTHDLGNQEDSRTLSSPSTPNYLLYGPQKMPSMKELGIFVTGVQLTGFDLSDPTTQSLPDLKDDGLTLFYIFTEYDADLDVESVPYGAIGVHYYTGSAEALNDTMFTQIEETGSLPSRVRFNFTGYTPRNPRATKLRIYRGFQGTFSTYADLQASQVDLASMLASGGGFATMLSTTTRGDFWFQGGLVGELDIPVLTAQFLDDWLYDPTTDPTGVAWTYHLGGFYRQEPPSSFDVGVVLGDQLVLNRVDEPNVLQYSLPGFPEYFPKSNVIPITTSGADKVLSLHSMRDEVIVATRSSIHALTFLPLSTDATNDATRLVSTNGSVGPRASTVVTLPQGLGFVWLSRDALYLSTGSGAVNVCADFSVDDANIDDDYIGNAVLFDNKRQERLELWCARSGDDGKNASVFHFYYGREHLKPTGFKLLGPHKGVRAGATDASVDYQNPDPTYDHVLASVSEGQAEFASNRWVATPTNVWTLNIGISGEQVSATFGRIYNERDPLRRIDIKRLAMFHSPVSSQIAGGTGKLQFPLEIGLVARTHDSGPQVRVPTLLKKTLYADVDTQGVSGVSGNSVQPDILYKGFNDISMGPFWLEQEGSDDGR